MNTEYQIRSLSGLPLKALYEAHSAAFAEYPFQWTLEGLERLLSRRGYSDELSFGAFKDDQLCAFTFNGIRNFNGLYSAYDCSTGTLKDHRKKGLASMVFQHALNPLKEAGVKQYVLEVLDSNNEAISVYTQQGFKISRTFDCFSGQSESLVFNKNFDFPDIEILDGQFSDLNTALHWMDFPFSWQNSFDSIQCFENKMSFKLLKKEGQIIGLGVIEKITGDIPFLAIHPAHRKLGFGQLVLKALVTENESKTVRMVNIDNQCLDTLNFIQAIQLPKVATQYEMILEL